MTCSQIIVKNEMLSDYCKKIADEYEIKVGDEKKSYSKFGQRN